MEPTADERQVTSSSRSLVRRLGGGARAVVMVCTLLGIAGNPVVWAQAPSSDDEVGLLVEEARRALADRQYHRAGQLLDRAIALNPRRLDAYVLRASVYAAQKQHNKGVGIMRRARSLAPGNLDVLAGLGIQLMLAGKEGEGVPLLEGVVGVRPDRYDAHALLARYYVRHAYWDKAAASLRAYLGTRPAARADGDEIHRVDLANALLRLGEPHKARDMFSAVVAANPKNTRARIGSAWATAAIDCRRALPLLQRLRPYSGRYPEILLVWGQCLLATGNPAKAAQLAQRFNGVRPEVADGHALLGAAAAASGDFAGALDAYRKAVGREPGKLNHVLKLAQLERQRGSPHDAAARLRSTRQPDPSERLWAPWNTELARSILASKRPEEAIAVIRPVVESQAGEPGAHAVLGEALIQIGELEEAVRQLEEAVKRAPTSRHLRELLIGAMNDLAGRAYWEGDLRRAERILGRAASHGDSARTLANLGLVRLRLGKATAALAPLQAAAGRELKPTYLYGRALLDAGKFDAAVEQLQRARSLADGDTATAMAVAVTMDLATAQLRGGQPAQAAQTLRELLSARRSGPFRDQIVEGFVTASRAEATALLRTGAYAAAVGVLEAAEAAIPADTPGELTSAIRCDIALAATAAGQRTKALARLRPLVDGKTSCPFAPPADRLAAPVLLVINEGLSPAKASRSLSRLTKLRRGAGAAMEELIGEGTFAVALLAAQTAWDRGHKTEARRFLTIAKKAVKRRSPAIAYNLAVLDLDAGQTDAALAVFEKVVQEVPEALISLGIAYERKRNHRRALENFRRAAALPRIRFPELREWIDSKERIYGQAAR
jgi:tetratricopeptide (TPR) repeat protein